MTTASGSNLIITLPFEDSLTKLDPADAKRVKLAVYDLVVRPPSPGDKMHRIKRAQSEETWSLRVSRDLRLVVQRHDGALVLCYAGHHDGAYRWAECHDVRVNEYTGAMQIVQVEELEETVVRSVEVEAPVFEHHPRDYLLRLGVPAEWLDSVAAVGDGGLLDVLEKLPEDVAERLLMLASGEAVPVPAAAAGSSLGHPDAARTFRLVDGEGELRRALEYPWDKWMVFLHPDQRRVSEATYGGPALVTGAAGTGKTVVALHRAARLAEASPGARVLLTSYSKTLAGRLAEHMHLLLGEASGVADRVDVANLHSLAVEVWTGAGGSFVPASRQAVGDLIAAGVKRHSPAGFDARYLQSEWEAVIDPWGLRTWAEYLAAPRAGRGRPLGARQRRDLWQVFEDVNAGLAEGGLTTWSGVCHAASRAIEATGRRPYDHVVADEAQDLGPAELRFLRSLVKQGPDDIFLSGDAGQQIFRRSFSWLSAGLDVRGRSTRLTVNYRTTEQIRRFADHVLPVSVSGLDGDTARRGSVSLLNGREPECRAADTVPEEVALVADWLEDLFATGYRPRDVAVFARTKKLLDERAVPAVERAGRGWHTLKDDESPDPNRVAIGTMHRAKGLEFRAVGVVGCQDGIMPLERVARRQADEADRDLFLARERNLLYVACTRAQRRLLVTWVGRPSRFLGEVVDGPNGDAA